MAIISVPTSAIHPWLALLLKPLPSGRNVIYLGLYCGSLIGNLSQLDTQILEDICLLFGGKVGPSFIKTRSFSQMLGHKLARMK